MYNGFRGRAKYDQTPASKSMESRAMLSQKWYRIHTARKEQGHMTRMEWGSASAIAYMEDHLDTALNMEDIAAKACVSSFHFQRIFNVLCGFTVGGSTPKPQADACGAGAHVVRRQGDRRGAEIRIRVPGQLRQSVHQIPWRNALRRKAERFKIERFCAAENCTKIGGSYYAGVQNC